VLCWPFVLVSQTAPVGSLPNKILIPAWVFGPVFWSAVICTAVIAWRRRHPVPAGVRPRSSWKFPSQKGRA
jgi:hypothetical protein